MPQTLDINEAKNRLSQMVEGAAGGEEIIISEAGNPKARLVPIVEKEAAREPGL